MRLSLQLQHTLNTNMEVYPIANFGPPPVDAGLYSKELMQYLLAHYRRFQKSEEGRKHHWVHIDPDADSESDGERGQRDRGLRQYRENLADFFSKFNGRLWLPRPQHYCQGAACCPDQRQRARKFAESARKVLFAAAPATPAANKWSKLGPVLDWTILCMLSHALLLSLMLALRVDKPQDEADDDLDPALHHDLHFSAVLGKRWKSSTDFLTVAAHVDSMLCLAFALEPLRYISAWLMRLSLQRVVVPCMVAQANGGSNRRERGGASEEG